ncbi:MAG: NAD(P)/FAD-dependent oxidoreductase [Burkholderiaceae bacterium]
MSAPAARGARRKVAVIGGGLLGMTMALRLREAGAQVVLFEGADAPGGLAAGESFGDYRWDRFYHVILLSDLRTRALLAELGLSDKLRWGISKTGFFTDGKLHSMSNSVEFLRFAPLRLIDKLRLGATIFHGSRIKDPAPLEQILAVDWLRKWSGKRVLDKIWLPLLKSKLGENYRIASAAFIWAIIARMYAARRSGLKQEMFGYIDGGYDVVLSRLSARLEKDGVECRYACPVDAVRDTGEGVLVDVPGDDNLPFDAAVLTTPPHLSADLCPELPESEAARLRAVTYQGVICATMLTREPLSPYYVTNITDRWVPFTGIIEMTALVDRQRFGGNSLVYLPLYLPLGDAAWQTGDDALQEQFLAALEKMYPSFSREQVLDFKVARARQVLAISTLDYSRSVMPPVKGAARNLYFVNASRIAYGTLNVNETLGLVDAELPGLLETLGLVMGRRAAGTVS